MTKCCKCGCGAEIADNMTWTHGHNQRGKPLSKDHKRKLSEVKKGKPAWNKGKPSPNKGKSMSEAQKQAISKANRGKPSPLKGKPMSELAKKKMSATKQNIPYDEWESFAHDQLYCPKFNESCRESNREKYNYECFVCGKPQSKNLTETGKVHKLSVHHVNMDRAQGCESNWNLVPLCMKCHGSAHNDEIIARLGYLIKED